MDPALFRATNQNPLKTLRLLSPERRDALQNDDAFEKHLTSCEDELKKYLGAKTWFDRSVNRAGKKPLIAYFCAEFAVHESLPQYSGGLGVLAGDHIKSVSDLGIPLIGLGLLYRSGFYTQEFRPDGSTRVIYPQVDFNDEPIHDIGKIIDVPIGRGSIKAKIWREDVGRTSIYLLDCDIPQNKPADRALTKHLYGGHREYRIRQEILLGVGGLIALDALKLKPTVFHMNEGHAAFAALHRVAELCKRGLPLRGAEERVRASNCFTTHTPVPAGNDRFNPKLALKYIAHYAKTLGISEEELLGLGRENPLDRNEEFCMTVLALRLSRQCNGVSKLHGEVSRKMWMNVYGAKSPDEVPIGHVTNGIHSQTWLAPEMRLLYDKCLKPNWYDASPKFDPWAKIERIPAAELWATRRMLRQRMIHFIRQKLVDQVFRQNGPADDLAIAYQTLDPDALTIGFARRFATYKRAPLIFRDAKRLAKILGNASRPVQLVFAGKAHPQDLGGQEFAQQIYKHAREAAFRARVVLVDDYDMNVGRMLTSGCDVWLNNPLRPQEASGTSGMKPPLHGGLNCSILDGWWPEAFNGKNGWAIGDGREFTDRNKQDKYDSDCIYDLLEEQIVPAFYKRDGDGVAQKWVAMMRESMRTVCAQFSTHRMLGEYWTKYYAPAARGV
jgi:starch phosphorylase